MKLDLADGVTMIGLAGIGTGVGLIDVRLGLIAVGILLYLAGSKKA